MLIWWCQEHQAPGDDLLVPPEPCYGVQRWASQSPNENPCRMVEMRLTPKDALIIERETLLKYRRWWCTNPLMPKCIEGGLHPFEGMDMHEDCRWVAVLPLDDALAARL